MVAAPMVAGSSSSYGGSSYGGSSRSSYGGSSYGGGSSSRSSYSGNSTAATATNLRAIAISLPIEAGATTSLPATAINLLPTATAVTNLLPAGITQAVAVTPPQKPALTNRALGAMAPVPRGRRLPLLTLQPHGQRLRRRSLRLRRRQRQSTGTKAHWWSRSTSTPAALRNRNLGSCDDQGPLVVARKAGRYDDTPQPSPAFLKRVRPRADQLASTPKSAGVVMHGRRQRMAAISRTVEITK